MSQVSPSITPAAPLGAGHARCIWPRPLLPLAARIGSFAAASALTAEVARHNPKVGRVVPTLAYVGAKLVGVARMYSAEHWASDVVVGSAVGIMTGRRVVVHAHSGQQHSLDHFPLGGLAPDKHGMRMELYRREF